MKRTVAVLGLLLLAAGARADELARDPSAPALDAAPLAAQLHALALDSLADRAPLRVEVEIGRLDPRLKLAPCRRIEPRLPPGGRLWGASRLALRCAEGERPWQVWLPVTVKVFGRGLVARAPLAAGAAIGPADVVEAEVDLAAAAGVVWTDAAALVGRALARPLPAGATLRDVHLQPRSWFAAGDPVRIVAVGHGWRVAGEGVALAPGLEGRSVRVRTPAGRVVSGRATGPRTIEAPL